jgi:hypothetical protein
MSPVQGLPDEHTPPVEPDDEDAEVAAGAAASEVVGATYAGAAEVASGTGAGELELSTAAAGATAGASDEEDAGATYVEEVVGAT